MTIILLFYNYTNILPLLSAFEQEAYRQALIHFFPNQHHGKRKRACAPQAFCQQNDGQFEDKRPPGRHGNPDESR